MGIFFRAKIALLAMTTAFSAAKHADDIYVVAKVNEAVQHTPQVVRSLDLKGKSYYTEVTEELEVVFKDLPDVYDVVEGASNVLR